MWRFYGLFTALAVAGCVPGVVSACIQLSDDAGFITMLFYFDDKRVFQDALAARFLDATKMIVLLQKFSANTVFKSGQFFFFSIAKILVVHRLAAFVKLGRSDRAIKVIDVLDRVLLVSVVALSSVVVISSFVECHHYAEAARIAASLDRNVSVLVVYNSAVSALDLGNTATIATHVTIGIVNMFSLLAIVATSVISYRGMRSTFSVDKMKQFPEVRKTRQQILAFVVCSCVAYLLEAMCASSSFSLLTFGDGFYSNDVAPLVGDALVDPDSACQFCQSCQPTIDLLLQFLCGCRLIEASILFVLGPFPVFVCLWSMTSESARKLLDSSSERAADADNSASGWFKKKIYSLRVLPPTPFPPTPLSLLPPL